MNYEFLKEEEDKNYGPPPLELEDSEDSDDDFVSHESHPDFLTSEAEDGNDEGVQECIEEHGCPITPEAVEAAIENGHHDLAHVLLSYPDSPDRDSVRPTVTSDTDSATRKFIEENNFMPRGKGKAGKSGRGRRLMSGRAKRITDRMMCAMVKEIVLKHKRCLGFFIPESVHHEMPAIMKRVHKLHRRATACGGMVRFGRPTIEGGFEDGFVMYSLGEK